MFLNITPQVTNWTSDNKQFSLIFDENPLADFVELPDDGRAQEELWYSNILCGIIRGALEQVRARSLLDKELTSYILGHTLIDMCLAGSDGGRSTLPKRRPTWKRHNRNEDIVVAIH
jgi:hypothetical protein